MRDLTRIFFQTTSGVEHKLLLAGFLEAEVLGLKSMVFYHTVTFTRELLILVLGRQRVSFDCAVYICRVHFAS